MLLRFNRFIVNAQIVACNSGKLSLTISVKPVGLQAVSQVRIRNGRQFWVVAAEREDAGRFIVRADENLTAFLELEAAIYALQRIGLTSGRDFFQTRRR